jgi:hypothetical protein
MKIAFRHSIGINYFGAQMPTASWFPRLVAPASLLPFCYPTARYGAGQGSTWQRPMLKNEKLIETYWYGIVREVTSIAELRMRCTGPLRPSRSKPSVFSASNESFVGRSARRI